MLKQILVLLGVIIVTIIIVSCGFFAYQYFIKPQTPITLPEQTGNVQNSNTQTADWKTYKNNKYGFEIKYPNNWYQQGGVSDLGYVWFCKMGEDCSVGGFIIVVKENTPKPRGGESHYLGKNPSSNVNYYIVDYLNSVNDRIVFNQILSTFKFTDKTPSLTQSIGQSLSIESILPNSGPVGTEVTITGKNFLNITSLSFKEREAKSIILDSIVDKDQMIVVNDNKITFKIPLWGCPNTPEPCMPDKHPIIPGIYQITAYSLGSTTNTNNTIDFTIIATK